MIFGRTSQRVFDSSQLDSRLKSGLITHYIGGGSGNTWIDKSGYGNHGVLTSGPIWSLSQDGVNNAVSLSGNNDYVSLPNFQSTPTLYSISCWAKRATVPGGYMVLCGLSPTYKVSLWVYETGVIGYGDAEFSSYGLTGNVWTDKTSFHHIVAVIDSANVWNIYFDGLKVASATPASSAGTWSSSRIGLFAGALGSSFIGVISDFRIYNRALSQAEIATLSSRSFRPISQYVKLKAVKTLTIYVSITISINYESQSSINLDKTINYESLSNKSFLEQLAYESTIRYTKDNTIPFSSTQGVARGDTIAYEGMSHFASASVIAYSSHTYKNIDNILGFESKSSASQSFLFEFESSSQVTNTSTFPYDSSAKICVNYSFPYSSIYYVYSNKIISYESDGTAINTERTLYYWEILDRNTVWSITTEQVLKWTINSRTTKWRIE